MEAAAVNFVPRSGESWRNPWDMYRELRDRDPVHYVTESDYWVLSRYSEVFDAVRTPEVFSSAQGLTFTYDDMEAIGLGETAPIVFLDPPDHTAFRRLVGRGFTPRQVDSVEPAVRDFIVERLERLRRHDEADIVAELLKPLPTFVVAHYLGVPPADRHHFDRWAHAIVAANALADPAHSADAAAELFAYFTNLIEHRRHTPGDDVVSELVAAGDGAGVDPIRILGFAFTMIAGGNDTTTGLLSVGLELLDENPEQRDLLAADPTRIPDAVEELLRLASPVQGLARTTTRDVDYDGATIPAGRKVLLLYASANRDEGQFGPDAGELDIGRQPRQILTFAYGPHHCLGAAAARMMGRVALEEILERCPRFSVNPAEGRFAPGSFVRWYESLPFVPDAGSR